MKTSVKILWVTALLVFLAALWKAPSVKFPLSVQAQSLSDPCLTQTPLVLEVNEATSSTTTLISGITGLNTYICGLALFLGGSATNINLVEGTGSNCSTISAGLLGGTTAATGANLAASQSILLEAGGHWVMKTATSGDNVCYAASGSTQVSGFIKYFQQ